MEYVRAWRHDVDMELVLNLAAGAAAILMILVGGYAIAALWWDDLT
jgi:hypothetical protein